MALDRTKRLIAFGLLAAAALGLAMLGGAGANDPPAGKDRSGAPSRASGKASAPKRPSKADKSASSRGAPGGSGGEGRESPARSAPRGQVIVKASWGSGPGDLGRNRPSEGAPEGPSSFAVDARGRMHVLDQVNSRVQIFEDGKPPRAQALPSDTFQDIAVGEGGNTFVMDRNATASIAVLGEDGGVAHSIPLAGQGVAEPGGVTGVFAGQNGVWVEVEHTSLVRVADASGAPDPSRPAVQGRFSRDGAYLLLAAINGPTSVVVSRRPASGAGAASSSELAFPLRAFGIHALEDDAKGNVYVAVNQIREADVAPFAIIEERETVVVVAPGGGEIKRIEIAPPQGPEEQLRPIRVGPDGSIYQLICRDDAAYIERYTP